VEAQLDCVALLDNNRMITTDNTSFTGENMFNSLLPQSSNDPTDNAEATTGEIATIERTTTIFHSSTPKQSRVITKLTLDANEHPFFRRVWFGRHRLDENSPILSDVARDKIKQNGGFWPPEWNSHQSIRDHLHFRHILVCFSGTSNANATSVYAQKVYDLVDVNIGYRFVPMNYHTADGELKTDSYLLNAISEQKGGGAEPFF
jgi:hypothetical protein